MICIKFTGGIKLNYCNGIEPAYKNQIAAVYIN